MIEKGVISTVSGDGKTATAVPSFSDAPVSATLTVPFFLVGSLTVGMPVVYTQFADNTGVVLARMDGEWSHSLAGNVEINGNITAGDVTTGAVPSYNGHTHTCPDGVTGGPK